MSNRGSSSPLCFCDVPAKNFSEINQQMQLVCSPHEVVVCGQCCMDFGLANKLRYDKQYLLAPDESARLRRIESVSKNYFRRPRPVQNAGGPPKSPHLLSLLELTLNSTGARPADLARLVSYLCYASRTMPMAPYERIARILDLTLQGAPYHEEAQIVARMEHEKEEIKKEFKKEKARKKASGENTKTLENQRSKVGNAFGSAVYEIVLILTKARVDSFGKFVDDFHRLSKNLEDNINIGDEEFRQLGADAAARGLDDDSPVTLGPNAMAQMQAQVEWMQFLLQHATEVPIDDPQGWPREKLLGFLSKHDLKPTPLPSQPVLVELARQLVTFCLACVQILSDTPDNETAAALGRESMGIATDADRAKIAEREKPVVKQEFVIDPQISSDLQLSSATTKWPTASSVPPIQKIFRMALQMYTDKFGSSRSSPSQPLGTDIYTELLQTLEAVAATYDKMQSDPGQDYVVHVVAAEDSPEEIDIIIRVLGVLRLGEINVPPRGDFPLPLLVVEFLHQRKIDSTPKSVQTLGSGLKQGTLFRGVPATVEEAELLVLLLKINREQMASDDLVYQEFEGRVQKGWKLSVVRPCDPEKKGGAKMCPTCGKKATKNCARCKTVSYCSKECQHADWKSHKKQCKKATVSKK